MERGDGWAVEVVSLSDMQQGDAIERVYTATGDGLGLYRGLLDEEGRVVLNFASFLLRRRPHGASRRRQRA